MKGSVFTSFTPPVGGEVNDRIAGLDRDISTRSLRSLRSQGGLYRFLHTQYSIVVLLCENEVNEVNDHVGTPRCHAVFSFTSVSTGRVNGGDAS